MAKESFIERRFNAATLKMIEQADDIVANYMSQGYTLTLRQLYYQFVARDLLANDQKNYKRLGGIISDARLAGLIDWDGIEDRTRSLEEQGKWDSPADIVAGCADQYREDLWDDQGYRPEVWIEKEALAGVVDRICKELRVPYFACRGYASQSSQYRAGERFQKWIDKDQIPIVFHLGDHDPSGIDMTRENEAKIELLTRKPVIVKRLALNMDQVRRYNPPPNPAKDTDARFNGYVEEYGDKSWELDALDPPVIAALIRDAIEDIRNNRAWKDRSALETEHKAQLERVSRGWDAVVDFVDDGQD